MVKEMEDNRNDLVVIVAGYPTPMMEFIAQNPWPGLALQETIIEFADYTDDELVGIMTRWPQPRTTDITPGPRPSSARFSPGRRAISPSATAGMSATSWRRRSVATRGDCVIARRSPPSSCAAAFRDPVRWWPSVTTPAYPQVRRLSVVPMRL